jgi:hypothetical protein
MSMSITLYPDVAEWLASLCRKLDEQDKRYNAKIQAELVPFIKRLELVFPDGADGEYFGLLQNEGAGWYFTDEQ